MIRDNCAPDLDATQDYVSADQVWLEADDGSTTTLQKLLDLLGPLKCEPEIITFEQLVEMERLWGLPFHPAADIFPLLDEASPEFKALVADIDEHGQQQPITLCDGKVLDGRNRLRACHANGLKPITVDFSDANATDPLAFVLSHNLYRRHLTEGQRAMFALDLVTTQHGGDRKSQKNIKPSIDGLIGSLNVTKADAARFCGLSLTAIDRAAFIRSRAIPEVLAKVEAGRLTLWGAAQLAKESPKEQREAPQVKFDARKPKRSDPPTGPTARAWIKMDDDGKLQFRNAVVEPWYEDYLRNRG